MSGYPTSHINATPEDFGKVVLMPGDPLRAEFVAKTYFENPRLHELVPAPDRSAYKNLEYKINPTSELIHKISFRGNCEVNYLEIKIQG